jgi:hypothetical protein
MGNNLQGSPTFLIRTKHAGGCNLDSVPVRIFARNKDFCAGSIGNPIVVMQDGKMVWLKPEEIQV